MKCEDTFFEDSFKSIEDSDLVNDPVKLEKMFQDFYNNAERQVWDIDVLNLKIYKFVLK